MSFEENSDVSVIDVEKPVKRVRWADEKDLKYEFELERGGNNEHFSMENDSETVSTDLQNVEQKGFLPTEESKTKEEDSLDVKSATNFLPECCDFKIELTMCNKEVATAGDSSEVNCSVQSQSGQKSVGPVVGDSLPIERYDNNNSHMNDLNSIIYKTEHMTLSTSEQAEEVNQHVSSGEQLVAGLPLDSNSENVLHVDIYKIKQDDVPASLTRKRSSEGSLIERQTSKLNYCLKTNVFALNSASEIKNAVYDAWSKVKVESAKREATPSVPDMKDAIPKPSQKKYESRKDGKLKIAIAKRGTRKLNVKESEQISHKRKSDTEEGKMAYRAWKKKKDELLNQQIAEKRKKEEKKRLDALMNERMRKSDAESAYLAWISHKAAVVRKEKKKSQWLLEREKEKLTEKIKRNDEAAKIYYRWLRTKLFSQGNECHIITEDKPPWTPPGKANSLI